MRVSIYVPRPSSMLVSNLLGVLGLIAVVVAIGGLAGVWWAVLAAGVLAVGLCALAQNAVQPSANAAAGAPPQPLKAVS